MIFVILCEVIGTVACGVILGTLSSMFMATRLLEEKVDRELAELREFLEVKKIPRKVRNKVRRYMEHLYRCKTGYDEQELLDRYACALLVVPPHIHLCSLRAGCLRRCQRSCWTTCT